VALKSIGRARIVTAYLCHADSRRDGGRGIRPGANSGSPSARFAVPIMRDLQRANCHASVAKHRPVRDRRMFLCRAFCSSLRPRHGPDKERRSFQRNANLTVTGGWLCCGREQALGYRKVWQRAEAFAHSSRPAAAGKTRQPREGVMAIERLGDPACHRRHRRLRARDLRTGVRYRRGAQPLRLQHRPHAISPGGSIMQKWAHLFSLFRRPF